MELLASLVAVLGVLSIPINCIWVMTRSSPFLTNRKSHVPTWILITWIALLVGALAYLQSGVWYSEHGPRELPEIDKTFYYLGIIAVVILLNIWIGWSTRPK
jgi:uncharacterized membrane protein YiaA